MSMVWSGMANDLVLWKKWYLPRMLKQQKPHRRSICAVLIEIAKLHENEPLTMSKLEEAYDMGRRMQNKLTYYNERERFSGLYDTDGVDGNRYDVAKRRLADDMKE